jgi:dTDP-3-amino-2,3,6-trideoxy-4-keto-D-glucose/dTDP-3-amino-3,4,6-trideoxy-alpha-D-glucose/dTDP-2,6-dideoxy-D-kanosamine transaminase
LNNKDINVWSYLEQYSDDEEVIIEIVRKVFKSGKLVLGENVSQFENEFSLWINSKYGTGVGNGTDAIKIALMAGGVKKGDEVITVSNTAVPTVSAIVETGAKPVFVDIDLDTYNMSVSELKKAISKKTKAVVAVHLYGHPCEIREIKKICKEKNVFLVEDCAQSHGSRLNNKKCGSFGDISAFSFYPTKILGAFGDGGMCVTSKKIYDEKLKMTRFYGMKENYYSLANGVNSRLDEVQAAILRYKLSSLDSEILRRREIAELYNDGLKNTSLILPKEKTGAYHSYYLYVVRHPQREKILKELKKLGINLNISYPWPIHTMPPFSKYKKGSLKNTEFVAKEIFSLPMYPGLTNEKIQTVIKSLKKIC